MGGAFSSCELPDPRSSSVAASLYLVDVLKEQIDRIERELRRLAVDHRYLRLLMSAPGIGWVLGYTIAAEIGEIEGFPTPAKLISYTGLCPRVRQLGEVDHRGALSKHGPPRLYRETATKKQPRTSTNRRRELAPDRPARALRQTLLRRSRL